MGVPGFQGNDGVPVSKKIKTIFQHENLNWTNFLPEFWIFPGGCYRI